MSKRTITECDGCKRILEGEQSIYRPFMHENYSPPDYGIRSSMDVGSCGEYCANCAAHFYKCVVKMLESRCIEVPPKDEVKP